MFQTPAQSREQRALRGCIPAEPRRNSEPWLRDTQVTRASLPRKSRITTRPRLVSGKRNVPLLLLALLFVGTERKRAGSYQKKRERTGKHVQKAHFYQRHFDHPLKSLHRFLKLFLEDQMPNRQKIQLLRH